MDKMIYKRYDAIIAISDITCSSLSGYFGSKDRV